MKRKLATIKSNTDRIALIAEPEYHPDYGTRWHIVALLPNGSREDTEVSGAYEGGLASAIESIAIAWSAETWGLEWLPED